MTVCGVEIWRGDYVCLCVFGIIDQSHTHTKNTTKKINTTILKKKNGRFCECRVNQRFFFLFLVHTHKKKIEFLLFTHRSLKIRIENLVESKTNQKKITSNEYERGKGNQDRRKGSEDSE
jgi:mRNA deadenylase 3'-5' endonuclease subunit Ccr4